MANLAGLVVRFTKPAKFLEGVIQMRKVFLVFSIALVLVALFSCDILPKPEQNEVVISVLAHGMTPKNATLVLAKDGNENWTELTAQQTGKYSFKVRNTDGIYSVIVVSELDDDNKIFYFNGTLNEIQNLFVDIQAEDTDSATLTINFTNLPATYEASQVAVLFGHEHGFPSINENFVEKLGLPKGKADLVIMLPVNWDPTLKFSEKVYISRNFEFNGDKTITLNFNDFKDLGDVIGYEGVFLSWLIGGKTINPFYNGEIPSSLKDDSDLYFFDYNNDFEYLEYSKTKPTSFSTPTITKLSIDTITYGEGKIAIQLYDGGKEGFSTKLYTAIFSTDNWTKYRTFSFTPGYLNKLSNNEYTIPTISIPEWEIDYNMTDTELKRIEIIYMNKPLINFYNPIDDTKVFILSN